MSDTTFYLTEKDLKEFRAYLQERESAPATIEKYMRDVRTFRDYAGTKEPVSKETLLAYKEWLIRTYAVTSVNSMLVALNQFLVFMERGRLRLKRIRIQRTYATEIDKGLSKEEFRRLVRTARELGQEQTAMIMETMCATGIRVSELRYFRVENIRSGVIRIWNKGKYRIILLPEILRKKILLYIRKRGLTSGMVFCTRSGRELNRSNIWKAMKQIGRQAGVELKKVFPHNLRHLFARTFYRETKNLINLADILGHSNLDVTRGYASEGIEEWKRNIEKIHLIEMTT